MMDSITAYQTNTDTHLDQFVQQYLPLVKMIALFTKRKLPSHIEFDDLLQSGLIGLLEAKNNYKSGMGASFETFASIRIRGAIIDSLRRNSWISRDTIKSMKRVSKAISTIEQREQKHASSEDIMAELGISSDEYFKLAQEINVMHVASLTDTVIDSSLTSNDDNPEIEVVKEGIKNNLKELLGTLPEREQLILSLYYVEDLTFKQIGEVLDLTEARVCQLHVQAIAKIRGKISL